MPTTGCSDWIFDTFVKYYSEVFSIHFLSVYNISYFLIHCNYFPFWLKDTQQRFFQCLKYSSTKACTSQTLTPSQYCISSCLGNLCLTENLLEFLHSCPAFNLKMPHTCTTTHTRRVVKSRVLDKGGVDLTLAHDKGLADRSKDFQIEARITPCRFINIGSQWLS